MAKGSVVHLAGSPPDHAEGTYGTTLCGRSLENHPAFTTKLILVSCIQCRAKLAKFPLPPIKSSAECWSCHRTVQTYTPASGDGTKLLFIKHKKPTSVWCVGSNSTVED